MTTPRDRLEEGLRKMFDAIERADKELARSLQSLPDEIRRERDRQRAREQRRRDAWEWKRQRHEEHRRLREERRRWKAQRKAFSHPPGEDLALGAVFVAAAGILAWMGLHGSPFWLIYVALGMALSGISKLARGGARLGQGRPAPAELEADAEVVPEKEPKAREAPPPAKKPIVTPVPSTDEARIDEVAKSLLQEFKDGPAVLREVVRKPEDTVEGLRRGHHALAERERKLRAAASPENDERLRRERADLTARIAREKDAVTRGRYEEALRALEVQERERDAMLTAANRLEAERTRLRFTLEGLHAQVVRTRALHGTGDDGSAALRQSLERLTDEVGAVAEALDSVNQPAVTPVSPISSDDALPGTGDRTRVR